MKNFNSFFKLITFSLLLIFTNCKKNETIDNNLSTTVIEKKSPNNDTITKDSIVATEKNNDCIKESTIQLPYTKTIDINNIEYDICDNCKIEGISDLLCDDPNLRYIALPKFENKKIILVPVDCADFNYNFYLAVISENKIISKLYAEGEWYEPENDSYKEITNFTIDKNYKINITKKTLENGKNTTTETTSYKINSKGEFVKI